MRSSFGRGLVNQGLHRRTSRGRAVAVELGWPGHAQGRPSPSWYGGANSMSMDFHTFALGRTDRDGEQRRLYHTTAPSERVVAAILGLATLSALGYAGASAAKSYEEWKAAQPTPEELEAMKKAEEAERANMKEEEASTQKAEDQVTDDRPRENFFKKFFDVGTKYYEGGFEETMTRREAALILGIRESASPQRIKDAHRKLLILTSQRVKMQLEEQE